MSMVMLAWLAGVLTTVAFELCVCRIVWTFNSKDTVSLCQLQEVTMHQLDDRVDTLKRL